MATGIDWFDSLSEFVDNIKNASSTAVSDVLSNARTSFSYLLPGDGSAGESEASKYKAGMESSGNYWGNENTQYKFPDYGLGPSVFDTQRASPDAMALALQQDPAKDTNVIERLLGGVKDGATKAWEKDPLEVLKFGANAIGGYYAAERANKLSQAQIDAYNQRLAQEQAIRDAQDRGIASYQRGTGARYTGPLRRRDGSQVFNPNGSVRM